MRHLADTTGTATTPVAITKKVIISKIIDTRWTKRVSEPTVEEIMIDPLSLSQSRLVTAHLILFILSLQSLQVTHLDIEIK